MYAYSSSVINLDVKGGFDQLMTKIRAAATILCIWNLGFGVLEAMIMVF